MTTKAKHRWRSHKTNGKNDHDRAYAIKMLDNIKEAMNGKG